MENKGNFYFLSHGLEPKWDCLLGLHSLALYRASMVNMSRTGREKL